MAPRSPGPVATAPAPGLASASAPEWVPLAVGGVFAAVFVALAWAPYDRGDWLLENLMSAPFAVGIVLARRRLAFSTLAWLGIFAFLAFHELGSHYTYSRVPWAEWSETLLGWAPHGDRNHYDRFVHLAFGFLLTLPLTELMAGPLARHPALLRAIPFCIVVTLSAVYELLEWAAALIVDPDLGVAFVGAQGDIWDAQKDMVLALGGSALATAGIFITRGSTRRGDVRAATRPAARSARD